VQTRIVTHVFAVCCSTRSEILWTTSATTTRDWNAGSQAALPITQIAPSRMAGTVPDNRPRAGVSGSCVITAAESRLEPPRSSARAHSTAAMTLPELRMCFLALERYKGLRQLDPFR
jgi:hypothetical protein